MGKRTASVLKKIGLSVLCLFVPSAIVTLLATLGTPVGGLLTIIIYSPSTYIFTRIWKKQPPEEQPKDDGDGAVGEMVDALLPVPEIVPEPQPINREDPAPARQIPEPTPRPVRTVPVATIAMSVITVLALGLCFYFAHTARAVQLEMNQLIVTSESAAQKKYDDGHREGYNEGLSEGYYSGCTETAQYVHRYLSSYVYVDFDTNLYHRAKCRTIRYTTNFDNFVFLSIDIAEEIGCTQCNECYELLIDSMEAQ